ncbi:DNA-binding protein YbaB [Thermasporomyces composti]|uniref:DNA-binding protein YbaB n=2 Tax=Thermasporomyces composti TaxID=696763 RepID=A0A3D9VFZ0_THECX|nr:DNA-binding protein YbaB [Thermasporomyces composti]
MYDADEYLNRINEQARESLERVGESLRGLEDVTGDGEAEDGLVKVRLGPGGRVREVSIDPRAMRRSSEELAELVKEALNRAHDDLAARIAESGGPVEELRKLNQALTAEHGSLAGALQNMQQQMRNQLERAVAELERLRPNPEWRRLRR